MTAAATRFRPEIHGFRFVNSFTLVKPSQIELPFGLTIDLRSICFGLCGGMCAAALDYFYGEEALPEVADPNALPPGLFQYLCERQLDSMSIPIVLKFIEWMVIEDQERARRMVRTEIRAITRALDAGKPVILGLIRATGAASPTTNHQVLALGYRLDEATRVMTIDLYDPNRPGLKTFVRMDLADAKSGLGLEQHTPGIFPDDPPLYGFFAVPYKRHHPTRFQRE